VGLEIAGPDPISDVVGLMMEVWRIRPVVPDLGLLRERIRKRVKRKARRLEKGNRGEVGFTQMKKENPSSSVVREGKRKRKKKIGD
jgi:hypothetical protein